MQNNQEVPTMFIELVKQQDSGFVRDDTKGTPYEETIKTAGVLFIPNRGKMAEEIIDKATNKGTGRFNHVPIRYIKGCPYIKVEEQEKNNWLPSAISNEDQIAIKKGSSIVRKEDDMLFDYLSNVFYNLNAPNRPVKAKSLFKVVEIDRKNEQLNERVFIKADALNYIAKLVVKSGKNSYKYKESQIDNLLTAMSEYGGDSYPEKINTLTRIAEKNPKALLDLAVKMDNLVMTEILHGIEFDVIVIKGNSVEYVADNKVLANLGTEKMSKDKQMETLAELLRTPEYAQSYTELKAKIELAQEKQLK